MKTVLLILIVGLAMSQRLRGATKALIEEEQTFYDTQEEQQFYISDFVSDQKPEKQQTIEASVAVFQDHEDPKVYIDAQNNEGEQNTQEFNLDNGIVGQDQEVEESISPKFEQPSLEIQPEYLDDVEQGAAQQNDEQIANTWNQENDSSFGKESKQEMKQDMEVVVQNDDSSQQYEQPAQDNAQENQVNRQDQQQELQQDPYQEEQNFENQEEDVKQAPKKMPEVVISKPTKSLESHPQVKHVYVYNPLAKKPFVGIIYPPVAVTKEINYLGNFDVRSIKLPKWSDISNHKVEDELEFFQFIRKSDPSNNEY
ncbi:hypothetical protein pb186bvf_006350 [Paramecium bursaria]